MLTGWYDAYKFQWNAALALVGFCLAYPVHSQTMSVRKALDDAIGVFEIFGMSLALARSAAGVMRDLATRVDGFIRGMWLSVPSHSSSSNTTTIMDIEIEKRRQDSPQRTTDFNQVTASDTFLAPGVNFSDADDLARGFTLDLFNFSETQFLGENGDFTDLWSDFIADL